MNYDKIGEFIKEQRKQKNLTQKELAKRIGLTDKAISKWERHQGCPDVSILELLAQELDCSILEILKGRKIEGEVIPVTEVDDYIKEGMTLEKNKNRKIINKILEESIIFIILLLATFNISQIIYIDKKYTTDLYSSYDNGRNLRHTKEKINKNMEIIKNNKGKYSNEDYNKLIEILEDKLKKLESTKMNKSIENFGEVNYTINDLIVYNILPENIEHEIIDILKEYDTNDLSDNIYQTMSYCNRFYSNVYQSEYEYAIKINSIGEHHMDEVPIEMHHISKRFMCRYDNILALTSLIIEVGDISE